MDTLSVSRHGRTYRMEERPGKLTKAIRAGRVYEEPVLEHIREQGFEGTAIDVGANFGNHSLWLAVMCGLRVEAFEPLQHEVLARNVTVNGLWGRIRVYPVALGEGGWARQTGKGRLVHDVEGEVQVYRLDDWELRDVCLMKLDCEDMEPAVLRGARETIRRSRPVVFTEMHEETRPATAAELEAMGYRMTKRWPQCGPLERWDP